MEDLTARHVERAASASFGKGDAGALTEGGSFQFGIDQIPVVDQVVDDAGGGRKFGDKVAAE